MIFIILVPSLNREPPARLGAAEASNEASRRPGHEAGSAGLQRAGLSWPLIAIHQRALRSHRLVYRQQVVCYYNWMIIGQSKAAKESDQAARAAHHFPSFALAWNSLIVIV